MESVKVKLLMIYRNRMLGSILVKHHKTNLNTVKDYGFIVFIAISCTEIQQMTVNPFSSQKKYWEVTTRNCSVEQNPARHHDPEIECIPGCPSVPSMNFAIAHILSLEYV